MEAVYPTVEELSEVNNNVQCQECAAVFKSNSNLNMHLVKTHKKGSLSQKNSSRAYYCPVLDCAYHKTNYFAQLKFLKQHYLKVHSDKKYICELCNKGFSTEAYCRRHTEYCNVSFKCCDCDMSYPCYETLKTHCRRKKHKLLEKIAYKTMGTKRSNSKSDECLVASKSRLLLPKPSNSTGMIVLYAEQSSQTDVNSYINQHTQTLLGQRMPQFSVDTQTVGDYMTKKVEVSSDMKNTKTQTPVSDPKHNSCNTSFTLEDLEVSTNNVQRSSSSTQTPFCTDSDSICSSTTSTHDSIHTDTSDLFTDTLDSNFFNCHMETQTDLMFSDELFKYCEDYTSMCTQTCRELLLGEIELNNIHTQTVFDDVLKSVESQTVMSKYRNCKDNMTSMETQTDTHFNRMLEEINA